MTGFSKTPSRGKGDSALIDGLTGDSDIRGGMSQQTLSRAAWLLLSFVFVLFVVAGYLEWINDPLTTSEWGGTALGMIFELVIFTFPLVGALIASREPRNSIGWIMLGIGLFQGLTGVMDGYVRYGLTTEPGSLPYTEVLLALLAGSWVSLIVPIGTFLILLFPDGHLPSPGWRFLAYLAGFAMTATYLLITIAPGNFADVGYPTVQNPLGIQALASTVDTFLVVLILIPISIVGSAAALVQRFRRSHGLERLQLKWLASAATVVAAIYAIAMAATLSTDVLLAETPGWVRMIQSVSVLSFGLIPVAIGVAMLRYRLYNIDRLINRALVYTGLTGILTLSYLFVVAALQGLVRPFAGNSQITVAVSTLVVAALFRPVRSGVQGFIDKRFYRKKYDSARTLEAFAATLRNQVDLGSMAPALTRVVQETMQPAHVSLWLRPTTPRD